MCASVACVYVRLDGEAAFAACQDVGVNVCQMSNVTVTMPVTPLWDEEPSNRARLTAACLPSPPVVQAATGEIERVPNTAVREMREGEERDERDTHCI